MLSGVVLVAAVYVLEPNNVPLLSFCAAVTGLRHLHPSRQHRPHARGPGKSRATTMAVSIANGLDHPAAAGAAGGRPAALRRMAGAGTRGEPGGSVEGRGAPARPGRRGAGAAAARLPLANPVELLDAQRIGAELDRARRRSCASSSCCSKSDSTNTRLLSTRRRRRRGTADVCMCELQHAGRGRRGRRWIAPFGGGLALSLAWTFGDAARTLPALSLGVGVAIVARADARRRRGHRAEVAERHLVRGPQDRRRADRTAGRGRRPRACGDRRGGQCAR